MHGAWLDIYILNEGLQTFYIKDQSVCLYILLCGHMAYNAII